MSENFRGAVLMMICMGAFVLNDAFVRLAGDSLPLAQILFFRGILTTIALLLVAFYTGVFKLKVPRQDKWLIFFRSVTEALTAYFFLTAVMNMPFANVTAILQILPMTVTLAAAIIFKEKVGVFRISLIMLGFFGVSLIINPAQDGFNMYAGYALISVLSITTRDLLNRKLSVDVPTLIPTVSASLGVLLFSILLITKTAFQPLDLQNSFFILAAAFFIIFGYYTAVLVMRSGEISFISPFRYTAVLFALMLGFVFFDEQPDGIAFLGMTIVIISGIALMIRNNSVQKSILK
ncbi:MAG: EamA family transporter [Gammaproteobacteria bacterium]|nr:EamA family transporter [Gammaproteobacteria bacterium]